MLPNDTIDFFFKMIKDEERLWGKKFNLSAVICRALQNQYPELPQHDINQIYSKRKREVEVSSFNASTVVANELTPEEIRKNYFAKLGVKDPNEK